MADSEGEGIRLDPNIGDTTPHLTVTAGTIENNVRDGIYAYGEGGTSQLNITNFTLRNNGSGEWDAGINASGASNTSISGNNIYGNSGYGVYNGNTAILLSAENNW